MRYLLFAGEAYRSLGGWDDFVDAFETIPFAMDALCKPLILSIDWWHIVDTQSYTTVKRGGVRGDSAHREVYEEKTDR